MRLFPSFRFDANWTPRTEGYVRYVVIFSLFRLLPQPRPCCVCTWGLPRSCSSRPPVKTCLIGSLLWRWYPRVQHVVSILFAQPIYLSSVLVHDEGPLIVKDHLVTCLTDFLHRAQGFVTGEAFMTMPLTLPSLMYSGNRRSPRLGIGSPVADWKFSPRLDSTDS